MSQNQTIESVEAEAARARALLVQAGLDIRAHSDPTIVVEAAKASFLRRSKDVPKFLQRNASPIVLVLLGGAFGATLTGLFASPPKPRLSEAKEPASDGDAPHPSAKAQMEAALLSAASVGLGYVGGIFIPNTSTEDKFLGEPKAVLSARLDDFLKRHTRGVKMAAANLFGMSRLSAATLIGLAAAADALGVSGRNSGRKPR